MINDQDKPVLVQMAERFDEMLLAMLKRGYKEVIRNGKRVRTPLKAADLEVCRKRLVMCGVGRSEPAKSTLEEIKQNMRVSGLRFAGDDHRAIDESDDEMCEA